MSDVPRLLSADAIFLGDGPIVPDGAVIVDARGVVLDAGPREAMRAAHAGASASAYRGLLLPGLVNAHTHLELSALRGRTASGRGFVPWVDGMLAARLEVDEVEEADGIARGVAELLASGTVAVGEVTNTLAAVPALRRAKLAGCIFHEVFGLDGAQAVARVRGLARDAEALGLLDDRTLRWAPSPHTLHTTHPDAVVLMADLARARGARFTVHLAEHPGERWALQAGTGPMVEWLERRTRTPREAFRWHSAGPIDVAKTLGLLAPDVLAVHLTDATAHELATAAESRAQVVLCPRSNLFIETRLPPLLAMLRAGLTPALGTDSLASCPTLDVLADAKALHERFPDVAPEMFLAMATRHGAEALGFTSLGSFARGKTPGVLLVEGAPPAGLDAARYALRQPMSARRMLVPASVEGAP